MSMTTVSCTAAKTEDTRTEDDVSGDFCEEDKDWETSDYPTMSSSVTPPVQDRQSDESSDGFSLVDDGDSIVGSEILAITDESRNSLSSTPLSGRSGTSGSSSHMGQGGSSREVLFPQELREVVCARRTWWLIWLTGTLTLTLTLWNAAKDSDDDTPKNSLSEYATHLAREWKSQWERELDLLESLGASITSYSQQGINSDTACGDNSTTPCQSTGSSWPNVTIPDFDHRSANLHQFVLWVPIIPDEPTRIGWESYVRQVEPSEWASNTPDLSRRLRVSPTRGRRAEEQSEISETIFRWEHGVARPESTPPYFPIWQNSNPFTPSLINFNLASHPQLGESVLAVLESHQTVLSKSLWMEDPSTIVSSSSNSPTPQTNTTPSMFILHPLFDGFETEERQLVGILVAASPWIQMLDATALLGASAVPSSIVATIENTCNQSLAFQFHEDGAVSSLGTLQPTEHKTSTQAFSLLNGLDFERFDINRTLSCDYTMNLHTTTKLDEEDSSNLPNQIVFGVVVFATVLCLGFGWFDSRVRKRDSVLARQATATSKVLKTLFPPQFLPTILQTAGAIHPANATEGGNTRDSMTLQVVTNFVNTIRTTAINGLSPVEQRESAPASGESDASGENSRPPRLERTPSDRLIRQVTEPAMRRLQNFLTTDQPVQSTSAAFSEDEPLADLFPAATVMFSDISGFTAWSSAREPTQVFKLLETLYRGFDKIARKRKVFKVETIGDCYVAVAGLPQPQADHAQIMAKFAKECMQRMRELTRELEVSLGPETGDLCMRFGLHSGPVTAGVLRGEKSRFQLFGDTVNFASRMESTGERNRIQASQATADLLILAGKENWLQAREGLVNAKGKGQVQTYWIMPRPSSAGGVSAVASVSTLNDSQENVERGNSEAIQLKIKPKRSLVRDNSLRKRSNHSDDSRMLRSASRRSLLESSVKPNIWSMDSRTDVEDSLDGLDYDNPHERLIDWNVEILAGLLKAIIAHRGQSGGRDVTKDQRQFAIGGTAGHTALDEVTEIIPLAYSAKQHAKPGIDPDSIGLPTQVEDQLRDYVTMIACMYRDNFFHNFEHASHVLMSSNKLLKRVINADNERTDGDEFSRRDYTSVIASDPLIQFAIVYAALIHDVDHTGVPNSQLVKEHAHIASLYKNKSIAEQNSLDLAWDLLMDENYRDLQLCIFSDQEELNRFRQLVVNVVLATDIFDSDMKAIRNSRFEKAFQNGSGRALLSPEDDKSLKATIVIEYIMQASDVSHTMQHWSLYQKWNERLFDEMYSAYKVDRGDKDPSLGWYKGELWFFDNYIIPLARKLKDCEVFGAASDECLNYALDNRKEWEARGEEMVEAFLEKHAK